MPFFFCSVALPRVSSALPSTTEHYWAEAINALSIVENKSKTQSNLVLAQTQRSVTRAQTPVTHVLLTEACPRLTGIAFAFFPFILLAFIPSSHKERDTWGSLGRA